jgi:hypothetical protein
VPIVPEATNEIPDYIQDLIHPFPRAVFSGTEPRRKADVWQAVFISNAGQSTNMEGVAASLH